jgi:hypothetical protein
MSNTKTKRIWNAAVGTAKKSTAAITSVWLLRNVRQVWDGGLRTLTMYLATLRSA